MNILLLAFALPGIISIAAASGTGSAESGLPYTNSIMENSYRFHVVINEIQAANNATIADEDGDFEDWIELYNSSATDTVCLDHYGLSDDYDDPFRWVIPPGTCIAPDEHLLIWASGKDRRDPAHPLHTSFSIAGDGEEILLTHPALPPERQRIDELPPTPMPSDISYGRVTDGAVEWVFFDRPTPGLPNDRSTGYGIILEEPRALHTGGFHAEPFELELHSADKHAEIRYTLDGSEPDPHSLIYTGPIAITDRSEEPNDLTEILDITHRYAPAALPFETVFKGTVVRARAFREGDLPGPVMTETYFIHENGHNRYSFPVVTINTDRDHFFGHETGIYVLGQVHEEWVAGGGFNPNGGAPANYNRTGREWERPAHFTLFKKDGSRAISQDIGVRIHGGWSRAFPQKSLRLYSRSDYGESRFRYRFFPDLELDDFNRLILRCSGQDQTATMFRDVFTQESVRHMNFDIQHFLPAVVFLNGEYWGIYNIRQRYDRYYFETHYGLEEGQLDLLTTSALNPKEGENSDYIAMRQFIDEEDMSNDEHYEQVTRQMDINNFIDYFIVNIFADNTDWPHNNIDFWRKNHGEYRPDTSIPEHDGRWRWVLVDTDFGFGWYSSCSNNTMNRVTGWGRQPWSNTLFDGLMDNSDFRDTFLNRFADMLNTTFLPDRMMALLDSLKTIYAPEIVEHIKRRGNAGNWPYPLNYEQWVDKVDVIRTFAERRPEHVWRHLMGFDEQDTFRLTLDVTAPGRIPARVSGSDWQTTSGTEKYTKAYSDTGSGSVVPAGFGTVAVNSIDIDPLTEGISDEPWPWSGTYFSGVPVTVRAEPGPGYEFFRWEEVGAENITFSTDEIIEVTATDSIHLRAVFRAFDTAAGEDEVPAHYTLYQNYPNPFNPQTTIRFALPEPAEVRIDLFDLTGRHVALLLNENRSEGHHRVAFCISAHPELASGIYLYRLEAGDFREVKKMTIIK